MDKAGENRRTQAFDWRDCAVIAVLIVVIVVYFRSLLWTDGYIYGELDIRRHFYLFKKVSYELMRGGELPLWIPYLYCGMPLLAGSQVTPFYPVDLVLMLTRAPLNMVFNWDVLIHLIACQAFSYLFFRRLFGRRVAVAFCSIWFWNVFFLNSIDSGDALNIRAMLLVPAVFYFTEAGLGEGGRPRDFLFGALALCMQILCGGLQFTFYTMAAATAYAAFRVVSRWRRGEETLRPMLGFAALIVVGLALASVQLIPAWEYGRLSVRSTGIPWFKVWAIKPYQLIGYVVPMFEGRGREHGYFGIAPLVLAAYSLLYWKSSRKYFFIALGIFSIVYSFGGNTLVSSYLAGLPMVRDFRGPYRAAIFFNLSVFVLAGGTLASLLNSGDSAPRRGRPLGFAVVGVALTAGFVATAALSRGYLGFSGSVVAASAAFLVLSIAAVFVLLTSERFKTLSAFALVLLLAGDAALNHGSFYSPTRICETLGRDVSVGFLEEDLDDALYRIAVYDTAHINYFGLYGFESANGHHPFPPARYATFLPLLRNPAAASLAGVKYNVIYAKDEQGRPFTPPVESFGEVFFRPAPLPPMARAFLVNEYRVLPAAEIPDVLQRREFDPAREVILEKSPAGFSPPGAPRVKGSATVVSHTANEVSIETQSEREAVLVLTDSYYPGWTAEVDGKRTEILRADYVFRAVPLSAGRHAVVFKFRPGSFLFGAAVSCAGAAVWSVWGILLILRRRR